MDILSIDTYRKSVTILCGQDKKERNDMANKDIPEEARERVRQIIALTKVERGNLHGISNLERLTVAEAFKLSAFQVNQLFMDEWGQAMKEA